MRRYIDARSIPAANSAGNTSPMAASSFTSRVRWSSSTSATVSTPLRAAPASSHGESRSRMTKYASTMPNSRTWLMASLTSASRRSTRNTPGTAQAAATATTSEDDLELDGVHGGEG